MGLPAYQEPISNKIRIGGFIDTETTGFSHYQDEIIELSIVLFAYETKSGQILGILEEYSSLREPSCGINKSATKVNGITSVMVKGHNLDSNRIEKMIATADILIAHNARFDIGFIVKLFPSILNKHWYCSMSGVNWVGHGFKNKKLHDLLAANGIRIEYAHRALDDVMAGIELLSLQNPNGEFYFKELIGSSVLNIDNFKGGVSVSSYEASGNRKYTYKSEFDKAIHTLEGIIKGIALDKEINKFEIEELINWCNLHNRFIQINPFKELIPLIEKSIEDKELSIEEREDILWLCNNVTSGNKYYDVITSDIQRLQGLLHGILSDNNINEQELIGLNNWLQENEHLANTYPYDEVYSLVISVLADKKIDDNERKILRVFFTEFIDTQASYNIDEVNEFKKEIKISGICAVDPKITLPKNIFCFTGSSSRATRSELKVTVESLDGIFQDNVNRSTNYLIIGGLGNPCWAFASYGRKVEKAMNLRKEGYPVVIVHENDFWDILESLRI